MSRMSLIQQGDILLRAMRLGKENHQSAPKEHHVAFANAVATLVTGHHDGIGTPSMREHLARQIGREKGKIGRYSFEKAADLVEKACYGPVTEEHALVLEKEQCRNDLRTEVQYAYYLLEQKRLRERKKEP